MDDTLEHIAPENLAGRLKRIAQIIEDVDNRCMFVDGPVSPTLQEMTQEEISEVYHLAKGARFRPPAAGDAVRERELELEAEAHRYQTILEGRNREVIRAQWKIEALEALLVDCADVAERMKWHKYGLCDSIDNDGEAYPSKYLSDTLERIRAALAKSGEVKE